MRRASSASATCIASRSASEKAATARTPMARAPRMTRQAISPRLATRILRNTLFPLARGFYAHRLELLHPGGFALLQERGDALLAFGRHADLGDALRGVIDHRVIDGAA